MATKFIQTAVTSLNNNNANEVLRRIGQHCIKQAYAGNMDDTQYAIDNLSQCWRVPFVSWLRSVGKLDIANPAVGSAKYTVNGVKNPKLQSKAIEASKVTDVLQTAHVVKQAPKAKELTGTVGERATSYMVKLLKRIREADPETAAFINDVWSQKVNEAIKAEMRQLRQVA